MEVRLCGKKAIWRIVGVGTKDVYMCGGHGGRRDILVLMMKGILIRREIYDSGRACEGEVVVRDKMGGVTLNGKVK